MKNFKINQVNPEIKNGWTVQADTKRFGENQIMFEGSVRPDRTLLSVV